MVRHGKYSIFSGFANESRDAHVSLIWDFGGAGQEIIALAHGTLPDKPLGRMFVGDGVKILALCLTNDEADPECLGAEYVARKVE